MTVAVGSAPTAMQQDRYADTRGRQGILAYLDELAGLYGASYLDEFRHAIEHYAPDASRFLEWGSGATTKVLCDIARSRSSPFVLSIDHHRDHQRAVAANLPNHPFLHFRTLDLQGPSSPQADAGPSYSSYPFLMEMTFDVIFIDGRRRAECALIAAQVAADDAIVIVHDWRRSRYRPMRILFDTLFEGEQFLVLRAKTFLKREPPSRSERRVILVPARGSRGRRELEITWPYTVAYAKAVGADCHVVGESSNLPVHRLKCEALDLARQYDRTLLLDADVLVRAGAPDIFDHVPADHLGAFAEGRIFPRGDWCVTLQHLYGLDKPIDPEEYFNSGVLVFSQSNLALLEALSVGTVYGHPQFEQGFLNAKRVELDIPLFRLSPDFNYIPEVSVQPNDWRFASFYHPAGAGKGKCLYESLWEDKTGARDTFSLRRFLSADIRRGLLWQGAEQVQGKELYIFDPTDFHYAMHYAKPIYTEQGIVVAYFPAVAESPARPLAVYGPYVELQEGRWRAQYLKADDSVLVYDGAYVDVTRSGGVDVVFGSDWPGDGTFEFVLDEPMEGIEFRIHRVDAPAEFAFMRLERLPDHDA